MTPTKRRAWSGLGALLLPVFLVSMDASVLYLAMPSLTNALDPTAAQQLWILDVYSFMLAGLLITMGNLGDRWGRRRLMTWGAALFGVASLFAAFAPSPELLIAARALMGVGGATLLPASLALIAHIFREPQARGVAIGIWTAAFSSGLAVGPVLGGLLLHSFWWGSVFLINVPVFVAFLIAGPLLIDESPKRRNAPFDLLGVVLSMAAIFPLVYAVKSAASHGVSLGTTGIGLVGAGILVLFLRQQRSATAPMIPFDLFRAPLFTVAICSTVVALATLSAMSYLTGIYLQSGLGFEVLVAAWLSFPSAVVVAVFSWRAPWIGRHLGQMRTLLFSLLFPALGLATLLGLGTDGPAWVYVLGSVVAGIGYGVLFTFVSEIALAAVPPERAGQASSISEMSFELGNALGLAALGSVATAVFTRQDGTARTLGDAVERARQIGGSAGGELVRNAQAAWVNALTVTLAVATVLLLVTAAAAWLTLRKSDPITATHPT